MSTCAGAGNLQASGIHCNRVYHIYTAQTAKPNAIHRAPRRGAAKPADVAKSSRPTREEKVIRWISVGNIRGFDKATTLLEKKAQAATHAITIGDKKKERPNDHV